MWIFIPTPPPRCGETYLTNRFIRRRKAQGSRLSQRMNTPPYRGIRFGCGLGRLDRHGTNAKPKHMNVGYIWAKDRQLMKILLGILRVEKEE